VTERDPWAILGVTPSASAKEIKSAYRQLCRQHHPDRNQGDKQASLRLQEVIRAYEAISSGQAPAPQSSTWNESSSFPDLDQQDPAVAPGPKQIEIDFAQAYSGAVTSAPVTLDVLCSTCGGSGSAPGYKPRVCSPCRGTGRHRAGNVTAECVSCSGKGFIIENPCGDCRGGRLEKTITVEINIPPGVWDGYKMKASAPGAVVQVEIKVKPSSVFHRRPENPADLFIQVPISYAEAVLGASVKIPTPSKVIGLKVPPGTATDKPFRIKGQGMPILGSEQFGDLYAELFIAVPEEPSSKQQRLIAELKHLDDPELRAALFQNIN
jgi:molecular chaperone DnaJ